MLSEQAERDGMDPMDRPGPIPKPCVGGSNPPGGAAKRFADYLLPELLMDAGRTELMDFPGGHAGFVSDSKEFAALLRRTLS
jgi:hypothetical protein